MIEELLPDPQAHVHVVDDLSTSPLDLERYLSGLPHSERLTYTIGTVASFCDAGPTAFDRIYHLASVVGPAGVLPHAGRIVRSIVDDTYRLMDLARASGARLLDVSTSEVYGGGSGGLCREDTPKTVPAEVSVRLEYAVGKMAAETALINTCAVSDLDALVVRPFNIAGPRQSHKGGFVLARFARQALLGEPLTVFGNGTQMRAFTHARDVAQGLVAAMQRGRRAQVYNIGNPANRTTILDLARRVIALSHSRSDVVFVDPKTIFGPLYAESPDKYPDASKAISELGWSPRYGIDDVIREALSWAEPELTAEGSLSPKAGERA